MIVIKITGGGMEEEDEVEDVKVMITKIAIIKKMNTTSITTIAQFMYRYIEYYIPGVAVYIEGGTDHRRMLYTRPP